MGGAERLNEPAGRDAILCVGGGKMLYVGSLERVDWHLHGAPVFIAGLSGTFRLCGSDGAWLSCRAAVIPAGVRHALDVGGDPLAAFYTDPEVADLSQLARLGSGWEANGPILIGKRAEFGLFRELYQDRASLTFAGEAVQEIVRLLHRSAPPPALDPRIRRVIEWLGRNPADPTRAVTFARSERLSVSRFLHLFSREVGVSFRRFRIWMRLRAAAKAALAGQSFTEAAHAAGFSDLAHFSRLHRETFGVSPSYTFRRLARIGAIG
jgi:AraC-like DNA-binding protein